VAVETKQAGERGLAGLFDVEDVDGYFALLRASASLSK
jgi:hypothetical protein